MDNALPSGAEAFRAANFSANFLAGSSIVAAGARTEPAGDVTVRPVRGTDGAAMERFVMSLSPASRRMRFHGAVNVCGPELLQRLTQADGEHHVAYVACVDGDGGEHIVGEARFVAVGADDDAESASGRASAEFAIAVADSHRGRGLADVLLRALLQAADAAGVDWLYGDVLVGNAPMAGFMRRHGFTIDPSAHADPGAARWQRGLRTGGKGWFGTAWRPRRLEGYSS